MAQSLKRKRKLLPKKIRWCSCGFRWHLDWWVQYAKLSTQLTRRISKHGLAQIGAKWWGYFFTSNPLILLTLGLVGPHINIKS